MRHEAETEKWKNHQAQALVCKFCFTGCCRNVCVAAEGTSVIGSNNCLCGDAQKLAERGTPLALSSGTFGCSSGW